MRRSVLRCARSLYRSASKVWGEAPPRARRRRVAKTPPRRGGYVEALEERRVMAAAVALGPNSLGAGAGLIKDALEVLPSGVQDAIPPLALQLLDAVDSGLVYQAFPGEVNQVEILGEFANTFLLINEQKDLNVLRLGSAGGFTFSKQLVENLLSVPIGFQADVGATGGIAILNLLGSFGIQISPAISLLEPIKNTFSLTDARVIAVNPTALLDLIPDLANVTEFLDSLINLDIRDILPPITVGPITFPGLPIDDISLGLFTIDAGDIIPEFDLLPEFTVDIGQFLEDANFPTSLRDIQEYLPSEIGDIVETLTTIVDFFRSDFFSDSVYVSTLDGPDSIDLSKLTGIPQVVYAGPGNDVIRGGGGQAYLDVLTDAFLPVDVSLFNNAPAAIRLFGENGDDAFVVNSRFNVLDYQVDGGSGNDRLLIEASPTSDIIELEADANGALREIRFKRPNPNGGNATNERQAVILPPGTSGGTFTLTFVNSLGVSNTTGPIAHNASAAVLETALESLGNIGMDNVSVFKPAAGQWIVEFMGALESEDQRLLRADGSNLERTSGAVSVMRQTAGSSDTGTNQVQKIAMPTNGGSRYITGGSFALTFGGQTTAALPFNATSSQVEDALAALPSIGAGNISVTGSPGGPWFAEFIGDLGAQSLPLIMGADESNLTGGVTGSVSETTPAAPRVLTVALPAPAAGNPALGGNFTLSYNNGLVSDTTVPLAPAATAFEVQTALASLASIGGSNVSVTGPAGGPWQVALTGLPGSAGQPLLTANVANLTGGVELSVVETTPGGAGDNEVQTVALTEAVGGVFRLTFNNGMFARTTGELPFDATAGEIQTALEALTSVGAGNVIVTGAVGGPWEVEFTGDLGTADQLPLAIDGAGLTGGFENSDISVELFSAGMNERQTVLLSHVPAGGTFTLSALGVPTAPIDFDATTGEIADALAALPSIGVGNVSVTGTTGAWVVEFVGERSAKNIPMLGISAAGLSRGLPIDVTETEAGALANEVQTVALPAPLAGGDFTLSFKSLRVQETTKGGTGIAEVQQIALPPSTTGGTFTLSFKGSTTPALPATADGAALQTALRNLPSIAGANVNVTGPANGPWTVAFAGSLGTGDQPAIGTNGSNLTGPFTTAALPFNATAADVQAELEDLPSVGAGNVTVTSTGSGLSVEFMGALAATPLELILADGSNLQLTGGLPTVEELRQGSGSGDVLMATTRFTKLVNVEQISIEGGGGDDVLRIVGVPQFASQIFFDGGDGMDAIDVTSNAAAPTFAAPIFPGESDATIRVDGQALQFAGVEGGVSFDAGGNAGDVLVSGTDAGNEIRFTGAGPGAATFANDSQVTISLRGFGAGSHVAIESAQGDDTISLALGRVTEFGEFTIDGGGPAGADKFIVEGDDYDNHFTFTPHVSRDDSGVVVFDQEIIVNFFSMGDVSLLGLSGDDTLLVNSPSLGSHDTIFYNPTTESGGTIQFTTDGRFYTPVAFASIEEQEFDTGEGVDILHVRTDDLPGVNFVGSIDGGASGETTLVLNGQVATFVHDTGDEDEVRLQVGSQVADVEVSPGVGLAVSVDQAFGRFLTFHAANADLTVNMENGVLLQPGYGAVSFSGVEFATLTGNGHDGALIFEAGSLGAPTAFKPLSSDGGEVTSEGADTGFTFEGFAGDLLINAGLAIDDEVIVQGANLADRMTVSAMTRVVAVRDAATNAPRKPVMLGDGVELATLAGRGGDDLLLVAPEYDGQPLWVQVDGGGPNASDRLIVQDMGTGNLIRHHQGADQRSGSVVFEAINPIPPVAYENIERVDILPLNSATGGTGTDGIGRIVVFHPDPFSQNDSSRNPTELPDLFEHIAKPNISPGGVTGAFPDLDAPGDEDWYRFIAPKTGTFEFHVSFEAIGALENGNPGLPGDGLLRVDLHQGDGAPIVRLPSETDLAVQTIGVEEGKSYLLRVRGASPEAINLYDIIYFDLDTVGPQVFDPDGAGPDQPVYITGHEHFNLFGVKPTEGPTPAVHSLTVHLRDLPVRFPGFLYGALDDAIAGNVGHYVLRGDHNGVIPIETIVVTNNAVVAGETATATIELRFANPLPDDRYTLTLADDIRDISGNALDGESNAAEPHGEFNLPTGASGDGVSGGDFAARFTVDSRPEIGVYGSNAAWIDINGNGSLDPTGEDNDHVNRDFAFVFGGFSDQLIAGDFVGPGGAASGYDKLGAYGNGHDVKSPPRWILDFDGNGTPDFEMIDQAGGGGSPVAGNFDRSHPGDEIGLFNGGSWRLDSNGNHILETTDQLLKGNLQGAPIVGDFDGDGLDDLATYKSGVFSFDLAANGLMGNAEATINFGFFGPFEYPVAADMNLDGVDDIGLFIPERSGVVPNEVANWYFLVSTGKPSAGTINSLNHQFAPVPFGNDLSFRFGDRLSKPIVGNFDPPLGDSPPATGSPTTPLVTFDPHDIDRSGQVTINDLLLLVRAIREGGVREVSTQAELAFDTNNNFQIGLDDLVDLVQRLRTLGRLGEGDGEEEGEAEAEPSQVALGETWYASPSTWQTEESDEAPRFSPTFADPVAAEDLVAADVARRQAVSQASRGETLLHDDDLLAPSLADHNQWEDVLDQIAGA